MSENTNSNVMRYSSLYNLLDGLDLSYLLYEDDTEVLVEYINTLSPPNSIYGWLVYLLKEIRNIKGTQDAFDNVPSVREIAKLVPDRLLEVIDRLDSDDKVNPLSANQGRILRNMINELNERVDNLYNINLSQFIEYKNKSLYEVSSNLFGKTMNLEIHGYSLKNIISESQRYVTLSSNEVTVRIDDGIPEPSSVYTVVLDIPVKQEIRLQLFCDGIPISSPIAFSCKNGRNIIQMQTYKNIYYDADYTLKLTTTEGGFTISNVMMLLGVISRPSEIPEYIKGTRHITSSPTGVGKELYISEDLTISDNLTIGDRNYSVELVAIGQNKLSTSSIINRANWTSEIDNYGFIYFKIEHLNPNKKYIFKINSSTIPADNNIDIVIAQYPGKVEKFIVKGVNNKATYAIVYPNMFGQLYVGARTINDTNFGILKNILSESYMIQNNFDMENTYPYKEIRKVISTPSHIVSDPADETFSDKVYQDEYGNVLFNHRYAYITVPPDAIIENYLSSTGDDVTNDRTELFRVEFYTNKDVDVSSLHNFSSEFTYVSPFLSTYIEMGEYCTVEKDENQAIPLYLDDDYTELLVQTEKSLYITPIKTKENEEDLFKRSVYYNELEEDTDNSGLFADDLSEYQSINLVININKAKINKIMIEHPEITTRAEALRKYLYDTDFGIYLELFKPYNSMLPITNLEVPIFEEGTTMTTNCLTKPIFNFIIPNSLGTIVRSQITQINNLFNILYDRILPHIIENY